ncbi:MAG: M3 family metallopeptidase, partial [Hydrogenophilaceae bacterium]|nr:M3 family metallopeptidase [Hydrogenophilaceae bacterium]
MQNPLLDFTGLPRFTDIRPDHVGPAIDQLLAENRALIARLADSPEVPTWTNFVEPLEDANERLSRAWGQVSHLHSVLDSPELREAYNARLPEVTQYYAELGQHDGLYAKFKAIAASEGYAWLNPTRKKVIDNELRDFRLGGAELPDDQKARFMEIQEALAKLSAKFEENLLDATNAYARYVEDESMLAGLPADAIEAAREAAAKDGKPGWKFTLRAPSYIPVMQFCDHRGLREEMYKAYVTRASEFPPDGDKGEAKWDNTELIKEIVKLRREAAQLLGYKNYAEVSLVPKMAKQPAEVLDFLNQLAKRAKPFAERDMRELREFAASELGLAEPAAWDLAWVSEKLRVARYAFSEQEVKEYFPEPRVLAGLFRLIETLYGLEIRPTPAPVWDADVQFYSIHDRAGQLVGQFYLDLYARETKRGGAWMDDAICRRKKGEAIQNPVAYLTCNFSRPVGVTPEGGKKPALFTHDEVITLFHEFGHGLHH